MATKRLSGEAAGPALAEQIRKTEAERIGVNFQTVGYLEREEYNPSLDLAFRISEYFKFPVEFIFSATPMKPLSLELLERKAASGRLGDAGAG